MASKIKDVSLHSKVQCQISAACKLVCIHASICIHIHIQIQKYHITKEVLGHDKRIPTVAALVNALLTDLFVTSDLARARAVGINEVAGEDLALGALAFVGCLSLVGGDCLLFIVLTCSIILVLVLTAFVAVFPNTNVCSLMPLQFHILYMSFFVVVAAAPAAASLLLGPALSQVTLFAQPVAAVRKGEPNTFCMAFGHPLSSAWYAGTRRQLGYLRAARDTTARLHDVCNSCGNLAQPSFFTWFTLLNPILREIVIYVIPVLDSSHHNQQQQLSLIMGI